MREEKKINEEEEGGEGKNGKITEVMLDKEIKRMDVVKRDSRMADSNF